MSIFRGCLTAALTASSLSLAAASVEAGQADILTIRHQTDGVETESRFSLHDLSELGESGFTTSTIWTDGEVSFEGVRLATLLEAERITSGRLELFAINDYHVKIPVAEARDSAALIAYRMNGQAMSTRDKGPFWLVYPYDSDPRYQSETYYSRSIWQIDRIRVLSD